jgi:hypothetical protein
MLNYTNFINENINSGKYSFNIFLNIIDDYKLEFNSYNYLNTNDYFAYFHTPETNNEIIEEFKLKKSFNIKTIELESNVSFFIGIINKQLHYGFVHNEEKIILGNFLISQNYFKNLPKQKCIKNISENFSNIIIQNLAILNLIKKDLKYWWNTTPSDIKISDNYKIIKSVNLDCFPKEFQNEDDLYSALNFFIKDKQWKNKIHFDVYIKENYVNFRIYIFKNLLIN